MSDFGTLPPARTFQQLVKLGLVEEGDMLLAITSGLDVTQGKSYRVIKRERDNRLMVETDVEDAQYHTTMTIYERHAKGPYPSFNDIREHEKLYLGRVE